MLLTVVPRVLILVAPWISHASPSSAEVVCTSTVSYHWKRNEESGQKTEIHEILFARGNEEGQTKTELLIKTRHAQAEAMIACRHEHESVSNCISKRYRQSREVLREGTFSTRRSLEEGIAEECAQSVGSCLSTEASQPECHSQQAAATTPEAQATTPPESSGQGSAKK